MTKAIRNPHENLVAVAHLMKAMRSAVLYMTGGGSREGVFLGVVYLETDHRTDLLLVRVFLKQTKKT